MKNILRLIKESKKLLPHANHGQKKILLKMLEDAKEKLDKSSSEQKEKSKSNDIIDPELQYVMSYAKSHYPGSPDKIQAFYKYVQRSLKHGKEDDNRQDTAINMLSDKLNDLQNKFNQIKNQNNNPLSEDYIKEK